jgi:hypothetical protein
MIERLLLAPDQLFASVAAHRDEGRVGVGQAALQVGGDDDRLAVFKEGFVVGDGGCAAHF